ncbi:GTP-binding protein HSR1-related protein [Cyanobacterium stanieri PCC 7202]|uniref:GTP-binding protein HSR1-related protein n=1 Tax=Cyanobacterium stanieri (strain ATCC 29140 / PCC 7202) TaxID=292563 RepID=K9YL85_CYASC|nr:GTP-binding protein HSR1-related protein [Cyanobacterium stanieri PCC 7202]
MTSKTSPSVSSIIGLARASLQQSLSWYASSRRHWNYPPDAKLQGAVKDDLRNLKGALEKLEQQVIKVSAFGLVSRGKSTVINALLGEDVLATGAINGVTKWPKSIRWQPPTGKVEIEFIDTPGLDEIDGESRAQMAREVSLQSDLILFVVAGDITRTEYLALLELRRTQKPLLLVFNKVDLYPDTDVRSIYQQLQELSNETNQPLLTPDEVVMVSAKPQPIKVRVELADGSFREEWEDLPPRVDDLKEKILIILNREGKALLALNALNQAKIAQENIAHKTVELRQKEAEKIIWQYAKYKALIVAVNPIALVDLLVGAIADLTMIRALARLYGLPITSYEAGKLWQTIVKSLTGLIVGEIITMIMLGFAKTGTTLNSLWENPGNFTAFASAGLLQGGIAGYGSYLVGKAAQIYLENGCTWGNFGTSSVIKEIIAQVPAESIISRLSNE